jgi:hypothetical protein
MPHHLTTDLEALPEIRLARPAASLPTWFIPPDPNESEMAIVFIPVDPGRTGQVDLYFTPDGGNHEEALAQLIAGGAVLIASPLQEWYGLDVGDTIRLQTLEGPVDFKVAGVTLNVSNNGYAVVGAWSDAIRYFGTDRPDLFAVHVTPGIKVAAAMQRILDEWGDTYNLRIETLENFPPAHCSSRAVILR